MKEKVIAITTDNIISIEELEIINGSMLEGLQQIVGGYIEIVSPVNLEDPLRLVCNEEGLLKELPVNVVGSLLYGTLWHGYPIVGNIAILQQDWRDGEPDIVGIPDGTVEQIYSQFIEKFSILKGKSQQCESERSTNHD